MVEMNRPAPRIVSAGRRTAGPLRLALASLTLPLALAVADGPMPTGQPAPVRLAERAVEAAGREKPGADAEVHPIEQARQLVAECKARFAKVSDYTCTFYKRERIGGDLTPLNVMTMKVRSSPWSIYFKFQRPNKGREALYVSGRHGNKVQAHDVGFGKLFAGTMSLDPHGSRAMSDNRHPITEAGIGSLIETVHASWGYGLHYGDTIVKIHPHSLVGERKCTMIETKHPTKYPRDLFYQVKLYIDQELGLPVRFEGYDWPKKKGQAPELLEEYTYADLKLNPGLHDSDFDASNAHYSFGRF
ncbi:DUF1571 domain-containing protein [Isosphaeraceae bacterium EP7]